MKHIDEKKSDYSFICDECSYDVPDFEFRLSAVQYGIIFLHGPNDVFMGILCPKCQKMSLNRYDTEYIKGLKSRLFYSTQSDALFKYHSFPYTHDYHESLLDNLFTSKIAIGFDIGCIEESEIFARDDDSKTHFSNKYCSYSWGDEAIGPMLNVCWADEDKIESLVKIENETGLKVFPRYIGYVPTYLLINIFCEDYNYFDKELIANNLSESFQVLEEYPTQREISRDSDFLNILINSMQDKNVIKKISTKENKIVIDEMKEKFITFYKKGYLKHFLEKSYLEFLHEYIGINQQINFSYQVVNDLLSKYLKILINLVKEKETERPMQKIREECRKIAKRLWKKYPKMTIQDMIFRDEIAHACGQKLYTEDTIRNWIKDLCPNRLPGRRPQK